MADEQITIPKSMQRWLIGAGLVTVLGGGGAGSALGTMFGGEEGKVAQTECSRIEAQLHERMNKLDERITERVESVEDEVDKNAGAVGKLRKELRREGVINAARTTALPPP